MRCALRVGMKIILRQRLQNRLWIFKFDTLLDHLLQCDSYAQQECSRLGRNMLNVKGKLNHGPKLFLTIANCSLNLMLT